jgi:hypothetical protein
MLDDNALSERFYYLMENNRLDAIRCSKIANDKIKDGDTALDVLKISREVCKGTNVLFAVFFCMCNVHNIDCHDLSVKKRKQNQINAE